MQIFIVGGRKPLSYSYLGLATATSVVLSLRLSRVTLLEACIELCRLAYSAGRYNVFWLDDLDYDVDLCLRVC